MCRKYRRILQFFLPDKQTYSIGLLIIGRVGTTPKSELSLLLGQQFFVSLCNADFLNMETRLYKMVAYRVANSPTDSSVGLLFAHL